VSQAKDRQRKRENKRAKRSLKHKESVKQRNISKLGDKKHIGKTIPYWGSSGKPQ
jgi:hypothetical protein